MAKSESDLDKVSKWWAQTPEQLQQRTLTNWMGHPHVKRYINRRTTGEETLDWLSYVVRNYFQTPAERGLSLGCGDGGLERHALAWGAVNFFDAYDASAGAIENAQRSAKESDLLGKINYAVADLNNLQTTAGTYGATFASMSVHHIQSLERVFEEVRKGLTPSGIFIMNEYIGPTQFQLADNQQKIIEELLRILPTRYRRMILDGKPSDQIKQTHNVHPLEWFAEYDPSEAVRSAEIVPVLKDFFDIVEFRPYGGTLLQFLLENIVGNFDDSQEDDRAWLDALEFVESELEAGKVIDSDFALIVARPKKDDEVLGGKERTTHRADTQTVIGSPEDIRNVDPAPVAGQVSTAVTHETFQELQELFERREPDVSTAIAEEDGMYQGKVQHYFDVGQSALQCIRLAMLMARKGSLKRILDLPCGHGRVLRTIKAAFPKAELTACDILEDGVDFCAKEFGAVPVYAQEQPEDIKIEGQFDLIWCGSLLTHIDSDRWGRFLQFFNSLLAPDGLLVFTTHGRWAVQRMLRGETNYGLETEQLKRLLDDYDREGFGFGNYFHSTDYGISASSPSWVCSQLEKLENLRFLNFTERGWDNHQDVVACLKSS